MPPPDNTLVRRRIATAEDITALNRVFAKAFTERYHRDGLIGVRVPQLNAEVWQYAIRDAGDGAMLWVDRDDQLLAFNIAHRSGAEGWMGPLAVRPDRQEQGIGRTIVQTAIDWLVAQGATTVGLETMPRTVDNIGFYSRLGFAPQHLTVTVTGDTAHRKLEDKAIRVGELPPAERTAMIGRCRERLQQSVPGYDYSREMELTAEIGLGDTVVVTGPHGIAGFAVFHSAALPAGRPAEELRVLKLFSDSTPSFLRVITALEACAHSGRLQRVAIRCQTGYGAAYASLVERGYRVRWTDLRMTLRGRSEGAVPRGEILFSNWEI
jgi:GNAT superfamily N-acetyltransferase